MIPRIFHQVWVGGNPYPAEFEPYRESWLRLHPDWEFRLWTEDNLPPDLRHPEVYDRGRVPAERSDIIRLDVLKRYGGVYMDADFECRRPLDDLLDGVEMFAALLKPNGNVNNAIFGATAQHPLLDTALDEVRLQEIGAAFDKTASGPLFLDRLLKGRPEVTIFPAEWFYPATPEQRETAYAVHHSARSWKDGEGWRQAALRAEERLEKERRSHEKERRAHEKTRKALEALKADAAALKARVKQAEKRVDRPSGEVAEEADENVPRRGAMSFLRTRS